MPSKKPTPSAHRRGSRSNNRDSISNGAKPPGSQKSSSSSKPAVAGPGSTEASSPSQEILDVFHGAFGDAFTPSLRPQLQAVKQHLFNRDYARAFGDEANLRAYVVRWSPSRALCYREVFLRTCPELAAVFDVRRGGDGAVVREVVCIGGGAGAEVVAARSAVAHFLSRQKPGGSEAKVRVTAVDIADWTDVVSDLSAAAATPRCENFAVTFLRRDVLSPEPAPSAAALEDALSSRDIRLVTILFTTNELYAQSRSATTRFLCSLATTLPVGCLLLVVESAGSYSTVLVNGKKFPMGMLLDHTLEAGWEKVVESESKWWRLPGGKRKGTKEGEGDGEGEGGLRYPIELEDMRYFLRVYRRV